MKNPWGKVIGGTLGLLAGGPYGAMVGVIIGHVHDMRREDIQNNNGSDPWAAMSTSYNDFSGTMHQATFTMGIIVLGAKMAKADGRVTREGIEAFKRAFKIAPSEEDKVGKLFDKARSSSQGYEPYAFQLAQMFRNNPVMLEEILSGLFLIAAADSLGLSHAETRFLKRVAFIFNIGPEDFRRIAARTGVRLPTGEEPKEAKELPEHYSVLGVDEEASNDAIKLAYRSLIREHHPDKLMAQGLPPELMAAASEKMKRINIAYETICKMRGIK